MPSLGGKMQKKTSLKFLHQTPENIIKYPRKMLWGCGVNTKCCPPSCYFPTPAIFLTPGVSHRDWEFHIGTGRMTLVLCTCTSLKGNKTLFSVHFVFSFVSWENSSHNYCMFLTDHWIHIPKNFKVLAKYSLEEFFSSHSQLTC
jgi:hypothetical protein